MSGDYFEWLGMPQALVVDESALKDAWHRAAAAAKNVEEIHRAYGVLRDPASRIQHLLVAYGQETEASEKPGAKLFDLFFTIGASLKKADEVSRQMDEATSALQRAGLTTQLLASLDDLTSAKRSIELEINERLALLTALDGLFPHLSADEWTTLATIRHDLIFLTKWENEIGKRETRLQETLVGKIV